MAKSDQLGSKRRRTERFRFEIEDPTDAQEALAEAQMLVFRARDESGRAMAQAVLDDAKRALDACFGTVTLRALSPRVQQAFQQEAAERQAERERTHEAAVKAAEEAGEDPPAQPEETDLTWAAESMEVRLIAACDADGRSPERWAEVLDLDGDWTMDDRTALLDLCYQVNVRRSFDPAVLGKGWAANRS